MGKTPFRLVYVVEVVMPMEYIVPTLHITMLIGMMNRGALEERLAQLEELEEEQVLAKFHQKVEKQREKAWHDRHINLCTLKVNDLVLLYDSKFNKFPRKLRMHWLGPDVIKEIIVEKCATRSAKNSTTINSPNINSSSVVGDLSNNG